MRLSRPPARDVGPPTASVAAAVGPVEAGAAVGADAVAGGSVEVGPDVAGAAVGAVVAAGVADAAVEGAAVAIGVGPGASSGVRLQPLGSGPGGGGWGPYSVGAAALTSRCQAVSNSATVIPMAASKASSSVIPSA